MKSKNSIGSLLQKWLAGDAGRREEKQLKQLAKEDTFLAEALEGFQQFPEVDHSDASKRLKNRLRQRTQKDRRVTLYSLPRVAATVALLVLAGTALWYINTPGASDNLTQEIALPTPLEEKSDTEPGADINIEETETTEEEMAAVEIPANIDNALKITEKKSLGNQVAPKPSSKDIASTERSNKEKLILEEPESTEEYEEDNAIADVLEDQAEIIVAEDQGPKNANEKAETFEFDLAQEEEISSPIATIEKENLPPTDTSNKRLIIGVVKGRDRVPLIGANVSVKGAPQSTITDFDGRFQLEVEEGETVVEANYTGFESQTLDISSADNVEFLLDEGATLDEVNITGYKKSRAKKADSAPEALVPAETAAPIGGFKKLERHIDKNLRYPKAARDANIEGKVRVQFTVNQDGSLSDFKILQSLGYGCDTEAIRVLEKGPKWQLYSFDGSIITSYAITFEK